MSKLRHELLYDIVSEELFYTYTLDKKGNKIPRYVSEGYDKDKIEAEGSIWICYVYDCINDYYLKNKEYFDNLCNDVLKQEIIV